MTRPGNASQLSLLDDKFEEFYAGYDDINVGGLEADEIEGSRNLSASVNTGRSSQQDQEDIGEHVMSQVLTQYEKDRDTERQQIENQDRLVAGLATNKIFFCFLFVKTH